MANAPSNTTKKPTPAAAKRGARKTRSEQRSDVARAELGDLPAQLVEVAKLRGKALIERYSAVVGEEPKSKNQHFLRKHIALELQCKASGRPTTEEKARIKEVQEYALKNKLWPDIGNGESKEKRTPVPTAATPARVETATLDPRLPAVGTVLEKKHGNQTHKVTVLADGFEYRNEKYGSLSKVARVITGTTWNGFLFFGLTERKAK